MARNLAMLLCLTLAACAAAPKSVHKVTNPPLTSEQVAENTPSGPAAKEPVELEGLTIKFNTLGFRVTLPSDAWNGRPMPQSDDSIQLVFLRQGAPGMVFIRLITSELLNQKALAEQARQLFEKSTPQGNFSTLSEEPNGRWFFVYDFVGSNGIKLKGYFTVIEIRNGQRRFLLTTAIMPAEFYDSGIVEAKQLLDSIAPL